MNLVQQLSEFLKLMIPRKISGKTFGFHLGFRGTPDFNPPSGRPPIRPGTGARPASVGGSLAAELPLPGGCRVSSRPSEAQAWWVGKCWRNPMEKSTNLLGEKLVKKNISMNGPWVRREFAVSCSFLDASVKHWEKKTNDTSLRHPQKKRVRRTMDE